MESKRLVDSGQKRHAGGSALPTPQLNPQKPTLNLWIFPQNSVGRKYSIEKKTTQ